MAETEPKPREPFLREITLRNILSFGPDTPPLALKNLNVLIGPNGSGKSNLLHAIDLLRNAPRELARPIRESGEVADWIWKFNRKSPATAKIEAKFSFPLGGWWKYQLEFGDRAGLFTIRSERIDLKPPGVSGMDLLAEAIDGVLVRARDETRHDSFSNDPVGGGRSKRPDAVSLLENPTWAPANYGKLLAELLRSVRIQGIWSTDRSAACRVFQSAELPGLPLLEDASNLALCLNELRQQPDIKRKMLTELREFSSAITDLSTRIAGTLVQMILEEGDVAIPASRLSDGTLHFLSLLAVLLDPDPPPLICLEEPEVGLHPDLIGKVADLLVDASTRTQLVVTTHSDILIDALSDHADSVVVCDKVDGATTMRRLDPEALKEWMVDYGLGQLWMSGQLGGKRWGG